MAQNVKNVLVGAANIFISTGNGSARPDTSTPGSSDLGWAATQSTTAYLDASTKWRNVGYTNQGFEVSYEPGYGEVMVDQLLDAARLFKQTLKIMLKTELTEGTLENINLVFGQQEQNITYTATGSTATVNNVFTTTSSTTPSVANTTLNLAAGALGDYPVERSLIAIGNVPQNIGTEGTGYSVGGTAGPGLVDSNGNAKKERVYIARRIVQMQTTAHALKRDAATVFPVQFRCLPDDADKYDGSEYGVIIDRIWG
jgi:hypothetical protein